MVDRPQPEVVEATPSSGPSDRVLSAASYAVVWILLLVPMIRSVARGWRPTGDDAGIAIWSWRALSLHPPLVGQLTFATSSKGAADPGPLEFWLLGPFEHLDPGHGALIGSAVLCAAIVSVALWILRRTVSVWAGVILAVAVADLAIVSPSQFLDPVWNSNFGSFWFVSFLAIAFVVGLGHLRYLALLLFIGSVTVDSHLLYLPTVACLLVASAVCGWFTQRPTNHRWVWWTGIVAVICWFAPLYQQFFDANPNISAFLRSTGILHGGKAEKTEGLAFGLHALGKTVSLDPVWASPRATNPFTSASQIGHGSIVLALLVVILLGAMAVLGRMRHHPRLLSMCVVSLSGLLGVLLLLAKTPTTYYLAFIWVNQAIWIVGICVWLTVGLGVAIAIRPHLGKLRARISRDAAWADARVGRIITLCVMGAACLAGVLVVAFPYGNQFLLNWDGVARSKTMAAGIEHHVRKGPVDFGVVYKGKNPLQVAGDEHGVAYLLLTKGWEPGMSPQINQLLQMPVDPKSPLAVFREQGKLVTRAWYLPTYEKLWFLDGRFRNPKPRDSPSG